MGNTNTKESVSSIRKWADFLASPKLFFYTAIWLLFILVIGTLAQKDLGLYVSQNKYFSSWVLWLGWLPTPGGRLAMSVMFINLAMKLFYGSPIRKDRVGTLITHFGGLLLLAGGFITAYFSKEGSMMLFEGQQAGFFDDYHKLELAVVDRSDPEFDETVAFRGSLLNEGVELENELFPGTITIEKYYRNIRITQLAGDSPKDAKGMAQRFNISAAPLVKEHERNRAGATLRLEGFGADDGVYHVFQYMSVPQSVMAGGKEYVISLRNLRYFLPFEIELLDFEKTVHAGTSKAKSYSSEVHVVEADLKRRVLISMNEPLRKMNYTFYQASFVEDGNREASVFAVVQNAGRNFPYISSLIMCFGLMIHIFLRLPKMFKKKEGEA